MLSVSNAVIRGVGTCLLGTAVSACGETPGRESFDPIHDVRRAILPKGSPSDFLLPRPAGDPIRGNERPRISNVQIVDLDGDGLPDILVCEATRNRVSWIRQFPRGVYTEHLVSGDILAPAHVEAIDFDGDGDLDLVVASLGALFPDNRRIGSVVILENDGHQQFTKHVIAEGIPRVADVRAGDLDGDGDLDLAVAAFGYDQGETLWLENLGGWVFKPHVLQRLSGAINALVVDKLRDVANERFRHRHHRRRRRKTLAPMNPQVAHHSADRLQMRDIDIQVHPVDRLDLQYHMVTQDFRHRSCYAHCGLRSSTGPRTHRASSSQ